MNKSGKKLRKLFSNIKHFIVCAKYHGNLKYFGDTSSCEIHKRN